MVFKDRLSKREFFCAMLLMLLHAFLLPRLVLYAAVLLRLNINSAQFNLLYYFISFMLVIALLGGYLLRSWRNMWDAPLNCLKQIIIAWAVCLALNFAVNLLLIKLGMIGSNPNQNAVDGLAESDRLSTLVLAVVLAPMVEEPIFRGGVFCTLRHRSRVLAYVVTVLVFGLYHIWSYLISSGDPRILIYVLQYVPGGVALCMCYDRSGSIWTAILFHMSYNLLTMI